MDQFQEANGIFVGFNLRKSRGSSEIIFKSRRALIVKVDICLGHAVVVHFEGLELRVVFLLPFVDIPRCEGNFVARSIGPGGRFILVVLLAS